jgi:hypothetical protein
VFENLFPEVVRTGEKMMAFQAAATLLFDKGLLDKSYRAKERNYVHKEDRYVETYCNVVLSDKGKRVLAEVLSSEVNQAYQARQSQREDEKRLAEV